MPRPSKPWYKSSHRAWYVKHRGKLIRLDPDEGKARRMWTTIVQAGPQSLQDAPGSICGLSVGRLIGLYLDDARARMSPATVRTLAWSLGQFRAVHGSLAASDLRGHHVMTWMRSRDWSPSAQCTYAGHVRMLLRWGCDLGYVPTYHLARLRLPQMDRCECVSEEVVRQFEAAIQSDAVRDIWRVGLACGARPNELRSLTASRIAQDRRTGEVAGKGGRRSVWFAAWMVDRIDELCRERPSGPLLLSPTGVPWTRHNHEKQFRLTSARAGVDVSPKQARKLFYSRLIAAGVNPVVVSRLMGHRSVQMGYSHYSGFEAGTLSEAVDWA